MSRKNITTLGLFVFLIFSFRYLNFYKLQRKQFFDFTKKTTKKEEKAVSYNQKKEGFFREIFLKNEELEKENPYLFSWTTTFLTVVYFFIVFFSLIKLFKINKNKKIIFFFAFHFTIRSTHFLLALKKNKNKSYAKRLSDIVIYHGARQILIEIIVLPFMFILLLLKRRKKLIEKERNEEFKKMVLLARKRNSKYYLPKY